jgi:hypothetical protein
VSARAQSVRWELADQGTLSTAVQLVFEDCSPDGQPDLPAVSGVTFQFAGQSSATNIVNFTMTQTVTLSYVIRARAGAPVQIPAFTVKTNKGMMRVPAFNAAAPAASVDSVAGARLIPERTSVWAGEVFGLNYELTASRRNNPQISPTFDWNAAPLVAEDWSKPEVGESVVGGERRVNVLFRSRAIAKSPGSLKLEAATHLLSIQTGTIGFGIISQPRMEPVSVTSDQPVLEVRPLPAPPAGFGGAVGQFKLVSKIVPEKAAVGEPITWTLELSGSGNWPDLDGLPSRAVSNDFQVVQPKAKRTPAEGKLFDVTLSEDVVLVPTKAGSYALGPVAFTYFDPKSGGYKTITAPRTTVVVGPAAAPQFNVTPPAAADADGIRKPDTGDAAPAAPRKAPAVAALPGAIPRDPLPGAARARVPLAAGTLTAWVVAPFVLWAGLWVWLAVRRARQTDPVRPRREARDRLAQTLARLVSAPTTTRAGLLFAWQRDTALLWQIRHAAPRASVFADDPTWATLWSEADRALYGADAVLPPDWIARAQAALAAKRVPGFKAWRAFLPQNLMPFAALLAVGFVATAAVVRAAELDAAAAYRKGDFSAAEKAWRAATAKAPTDWIARHNLSLALAQQERPGEAAAQAAAAFVQSPGDAAVRWHFGQTAEKAGFAARELAAFFNPGAQHRVARAASPATWQLGLIGAAFAAAGALGWLLVSAYGGRRAAARRSAVGLLAAALLTGGAAAAGLTAYGLAANPAAVVVARAGTLRSIPTEADTSQKTTPLAAGSLALADKTFLGWTRLAFENGQTGWVRREEVVGLWK